jgi:hypothetical protein
LHKIEKWIDNHPIVARLVLMALAGVNAWSAWHILSRSLILALAQGTLSLFLLLGAILTR